MTLADRYAGLSPLKRALLAVEELKARLDAVEKERHQPIAIVGVGCRIPGAPDPEAFWDLLSEGRAPLQDVPADRWDVDAYYDPDPDAPGRMYVRQGAFLDRVDLFEPAFFGIAPREAVSMDPQQRLLLEVSWEALENAGIAPDGLAGTSTGVFVGIAASDYIGVLKNGDDSRLDAHFASGVAHSIASGRLAYVLGLQGPAVSIDTACSSSLVAVHLACRSLDDGDCRMALVAGVNLILTPDNGILFSKSRMLAADGRCKTFDASADGFGRGEGCVVLVLKRLVDAQTDGDRILAVIGGSAVNQDGPSSGLTAPNGPAQESVIRAALAKARLAPADIDVIEAHGTGTSLGDPIELQALASVFASRSADQPLRVASVKTNVGHLEAAAGLTGLLKIVLALQHEAIPPHLHLQTPNPHVDWASMPFEIPCAITPWRRGARRRAAGISSFGFSGTNAHVIVEEAPAGEPATPGVERPTHLVALSARTATALRAQAEALLSRLERDAAANLPDIAYTANAGRAQLPHRLAVRTGSVPDLVDSLRSWAGGMPTAGLHCGEVDTSERPKIGMLFTGQGAQYPGMGRRLYETQPVFRTVVERCCEVLAGELPEPLMEVLFAADEADTRLDETVFTQPALFTIDYALAALWRSWGIEPSIVIGHSLGEYVAACVAGVLSLEDALRLVAARGRLMQALPRDGGMCVVFAPEPRVVELIGSDASLVSVAAINEPGQTVISGERQALEAVVARARTAGYRSKALTVSHAFHSPLMAPMLDEFDAVLRTVTFSSPRLPIVSNVTGRVLAPGEQASPDYWRRHVLAPVRFADGISEMTARGVTLLIEAGPHPTLLGLAARCLPEGGPALVPSLRKGQDDWHQMLDGLARVFVAGSRVDWRGFDRGYHRARVALPTYPFERERYWPASTSRALPTQRPAAHPLLGGRLRGAVIDRPVFEVRLSPASHPWIFEHLVHGVAILPGAGFVAAALAAAWAVWGEGAHVVEALELRTPLSVAAGGSVVMQTVLAADGDRRTISIYSSEDEGGDEARWQRHAEGTLVRGTTPMRDTPAETMAEIRGRCPEPVDPADLYARLEARGIVLGPAFRGLVQVSRGAHEALGEIALAAPSAAGPCHPIDPLLLDNAIQTLAAALAGDEDGRAYVPAAIDRISMQVTPRPAAFAHARVRTREATGVLADIRLCAADGTTVVALEGLHLRVMEQDGLAARTLAIRSWLHDVQWQPVERPDDPARFASLNPSLFVDSVGRRSGEVAAAHDLRLYDEALPAMEDLSAGYVAEALLRLGWRPSVGDRVEAGELADQLGIVDTQRRLTSRLLEILGEVGVLGRDGEGWRVRTRPSPGDTAAAFGRLQSTFGAALQAELTLLGACGPHLADVLRGTTNPLDLLFPGGSAAMAEALYETSPAGRAFNQLIGEALGSLVEQLPRERPLRLLEIGGGTGATSSYVLPGLPAARTRYTFSDISPAFTSRAARKFADYDFVDFRVLDIERELEPQGFGDQTFDVVIAANVLHATADLAATMGRVRQLLAPGGLLVMLEILRRQRWVDLTFGLTDGWWRFIDRQLRPDYPLLDAERWSTLLEQSGFSDISAAPARTEGVFGLQSILTASAGAAAGSGLWILLADRGRVAQELASELTRSGQDVQLVERQEWASVAASLATSDVTIRGVVHLWSLDDVPGPEASVERLASYERELCEGTLAVVKALAAARPAPLYLVTRGAQPATPGPISAAPAALWGLGNAIALEHPALGCRRIDLDPARSDASGLADELLSSSVEEQVALRGDARYVARLVPHAAGPAGPDVYRLESAARGVIDQLRLVPAERRAPGAGEVEIAVKLTALNFADVMDALGVRPGGAAEFGGECAGTVVALGPGVDALEVGDDVVAVTPGCFASFVTCPASLVARLPAGLSAAEAVTLPVAGITARVALEQAARLRAGERVLIHAAAGGVGLMAVALAQRMGAEVFATAGSEAKRAHLAELGVRHVMNSRDTAFVAQIQEITGGSGVHVVLNSLAGEFIAPSFDCLGRGGRFIEIGKRGWSHEEAVAYRPDVGYQVVDWGPTARHEPAAIRTILDDILERAGRGGERPLPFTVFDATEPARAFTFMAQARHIGKVLVRHRHAVSIRPDATYLVTGGLSGIGLLTAERLARRGAGALVLTGRHGAPEGSAEVLARLRAAGTQVVAVQSDVSNERDVETLFTDVLPSLPPLRGIVHSAGVLDDGVLEQQDWTKFAAVMAPKVFGTALLDRASHALPLDFFVAFSSVAAILGSPGQSNHSAANACLDALVHHRRARGLTGSTINWGAWAEVGAAVRHDVGRRIANRGIGMIDPNRGLDVFEHVLASGDTQVVVVPADWARYGEQLGAGRRPSLLSALLETNRRGARADDSRAVVAADDLMRRIDSTPVDGRARVIAAFVREQAVKILGLPPSHAIAPRQPLNEMGLDSLMAVELRNSLAAASRRTLPATLLFDYPTVEALTRYFEHELLGSAPTQREQPTGPGDAVDRIGELSDEEVERLFAERLADRQES